MGVRCAPDPTARETARGFVVAAPASGSGKTLVTLGLLRAFRRRGRRLGSFKVGPDFIDPAFHAAATGRESWNLDGWAMRASTLAHCAARAAEGAELVVGEGVMGLFDGAADGRGSTADVAARLGLPVILVVDAAAQAASAAAVVHGFATFAPDVRVAAVLFNRVGGARHAALLERACAPLGIPVVGALPRDASLVLPERHLGLVQAAEHDTLERRLDAAADWIERCVDASALEGLAAPMAPAPGPLACVPEPLAASIAVARDAAFAFAYPSVLESWRQGGAELRFFSPLAGEAPPVDCDAVYLPGGYPELHGAVLAAHSAWREGLRDHVRRGGFVYGECGGYMALGERLCDADGRWHAMAGLLPLETTMHPPRLAIGYRVATLAEPALIGAPGTRFAAHEFHYARVAHEGPAAPLATVEDADGAALGPAGLRQGRVAGSFLHVIDCRDGEESTRPRP